jgi:hypothetical protein
LAHETRGKVQELHAVSETKAIDYLVQLDDLAVHRKSVRLSMR